MEIVPVNFKKAKGDYMPAPKYFDIHFDSALLKEPDEDIFEIYPLQLKIPYGSSVCLY